MTHTILFLTTFVALGFWLLGDAGTDSNRRWGRLFGVAALAYFLSWLVSSMSYVQLATDAAIVFLGSLVVNTFSNVRGFALAILMLISGSYFYWQQGWAHATASPQMQHLSDLDSDNELLVEIKNGYSVEDLQAVINTYSLTASPAFRVQDGSDTDLDDYYSINIPDDKLRILPDLLRVLRTHTAVDAVEENEIYTLSPLETTNAAAIAPLSNAPTVNDPELAKMWAYDALQLNAFYDFLRSQGIRPMRKARIAIIDTGVDNTHEDLQQNYITTRTHHNGDAQGHGTHCAGIAAAVTNNGKGIASTAFTSDFVEITSIKVFNERGRTTQQRIIDGMLEAADNGCQVLSMSLGGMNDDATQRAYKQAIAYVNKKGGIVVVAAGNENTDARLRAPAGVEGVITVAAIDANLNKASFSNDVSAVAMGIAAPGVQIYSTIPNNRYEFYNGTSMATPYVAGLVGIFKSLRPNLTTQQAFQILNQSGRAIPDGAATGKLIQPMPAVRALLQQ